MLLRTLPGFEPSPASYAIAVEFQDWVVGRLALASVHDPADVDIYTALIGGLSSQQISNDPGGDRWTPHLQTVLSMFFDYIDRGRATPRSKSGTFPTSATARPWPSPRWRNALFGAGCRRCYAPSRCCRWVRDWARTMGWKPLGYLFGISFTRDVWMHRVDLARPPAGPWPSRRATIADIAAEWETLHTESFTLHLTGAAGGTYTRGTTTGGEVVEYDAIEFCRLFSGREPRPWTASCATRCHSDHQARHNPSR